MLNAAHFINSFNFDKNTLLGVLARQATKNALSIFIGTISGALNTIIVLPRAFENFEEGWGLLKILTAYALIFSQFFHGGIPSMIIRYFPKLQNEEQQKNFLGFAYLAPVIGSLVLIVVFSVFGFEALQLVNDKNAGLLKENMGALLFLSATLIFFYSINGYLSAVLKTTVYQFLNETFLKSWYLVIAFAFWYDVVTFPQLMLCYIGGYALATVILLAYALRSGLRLGWGAFPLKKAELATYSLYSILDRGAGIVVNNLDIVMIGILLDLNNVAFYTLAFYIGAVTQLPQKAISAIANPLAS
ncbi:MAG: O-antigen/teichoic acid export membrane protein, partial [Flavobacteriales bacterium]